MTVKKNKLINPRWITSFGVDFMYFADIFHAKTATSHTKESWQCKKTTKKNICVLSFFIIGAHVQWIPDKSQQNIYTHCHLV